LIMASVTILSSLRNIVQAQNKPSADRTTRSNYARAVLASAPVAYWRLDESDGPRALDASGGGNDGKYLGCPEFGQRGAIVSDADCAVGLVGGRMRSYIEGPDSASLSIATSGSGLTAEVWMRPDSLDFKGERAGSADDFVHWLGKGEK